MPIHQEALERVRSAKIRGEKVAEIMARFEGVLDATGAADCLLTLDYQGKDMDVQPGDLIPVITIGLRQATTE